MKHLYSTLLVLMIATLQGQITQSFNEPVVGDIDKHYRLDTSAFTNGLPISVTGSNVVWNYTGLTGIFPVVVDSFIAPSAAINNTAYPTATYAQHRDVLYTYYKSSSQQTELLGAYSPSLTLTFTNSAIIANYPINYGYTLLDPVSGSFKFNNQTGAAVGKIDISATGIGTLMLPNGNNFQNVICLRSVEILTLSLSLTPIGTFNQSIYNYYAPGKKFPVLNITYTTYQPLAGTPTITAIVYGSNDYFTVVGTEEMQLNKADYKVFPNPFHDQLFVKSRSSEENEYSIYDALGNCVLKTTSPEAINTSQLATGIYLLELRNASGILRQKLVKE